MARGGFIPTAVFSPWTKYAGNPIVPVDDAHPGTSSAVLVPDGTRHRLYTTHPEVRVRFSTHQSTVSVSESRAGLR